MAACRDAKLRDEADCVALPIAVKHSLSEASPSHFAVVQHGWEWVIEVMKKRAPLLVLRRLAKAHLVMLNALPTHEQHVLVCTLQALLKLMAHVPGHRRNDALGLLEGGLKRLAVIWFDLKLCDFENHLCP